MVDVSLKTNPTKVLNDNFDNIVKAFSLYYGEDKTEEIKEKFSKSMFIGYLLPENLELIINDDKRRISKIILNTVLEKYSEHELPQELVSDLSSFSYDNFIIYKISKIGNFFKLNNIPKEERINNDLMGRYNSIRPFLPNLDFEDFKNGNVSDEEKLKVPELFRGNFNFDRLDRRYKEAYNDLLTIVKQIFSDVNEDNFYEYLENGKFDFLEKIAIGLEEGREEYSKYVNEKLKDLIELNDLLKKNQTEFFKKYFSAYIDEFVTLLNEEDRFKYEQEKQKDSFYISSIKGIEIFFENSFTSNSCIDYFNDTSDKKLIDSKTNDFFKNCIKEKRVKYFKYKGLDLGDNYDDYLNDPRVKDIWPSKELINSLSERKKYYQNLFNLDYYGSIPFYKETLAKINSLNLLDKDISFNQRMYTEKMTCINPNIRITEKGYDLFSLLLIDSGSLTDYADVRLIHELNHLYELSLVNIDENNNSYEMICGWDYIDGKFNQASASKVDTVTKDENKRKYELFSEIINELIAQDITEKMHNNGLYIFNEEGNAKISGGTGYENTILLVKDFFNTYKNEIIESRRNNNIQLLFDKVGKENFDRLNGLFDKMKPILGFNYFNMLSNYKAGNMTDDVKLFLSILEEKNQILEAMKEYSSKKVM